MIKTIFVLWAAFAVVKAELNYSLMDESQLVSRVDDYINLNRQQYLSVLEYYDTRLEHFRKHYLGRIEGINVQLDMVTASLDQIEQHLNPLERLNDFTKKCVVGQRYIISSKKDTKAAVTKCVSEATGQSDWLLANAVATKITLENSYLYKFEQGVKNCKTNITCVVDVTTNTNALLTENQKTFETLLDTAECSAKANIKKALDCSYAVQRDTTAKIAKANLLINRCIAGEDDCKPCDEHTCSESYNWEVDYSSNVISNPFYENIKHPTCVILRPEALLPDNVM